MGQTCLIRNIKDLFVCSIDWSIALLFEVEGSRHAKVVKFGRLKLCAHPRHLLPRSPRSQETPLLVGLLLTAYEFYL